MRLNRLTRGQSATIAAVHAQDDCAKRLADLGFIHGASVEMLRPGNPCIIRIERSRIGLGAGHQSAIELAIAVAAVATVG
jgi:Fe2+ transport system protein FeoA